MRKYLAALLLCPLLLLACEKKPAVASGAIAVVDPWARPAASGGNSAAYLVIRNSGSQADRLVKAECDAAAVVEIHETTMRDDVMSMSPVPLVEAPARTDVALKPGGYHVMLVRLTRELRAGETITVTLSFEKAGRIPVVATIREQ